MLRVLVTGASGFIGSHLVEALVARGDDVTALVREASAIDRLRSLGVALAFGDVTDPAGLRRAVAGQSVVYHLAGLTKTLRTRRFYEVNESGVRNAALACAEQPDPPMLVAVSSLAAAGPSPPRRLRAEGDPAHPVSHYGRSKRAGEKAAEEFADRVPITIVRPPIVFGERDTATLQMFRAVARSRVHLVPGYAPHRFSTIHADDLAALLILAAERGSRLPPRGSNGAHANAPGYYFAACDEHPSYYRLGRMIGEALGRRHTLTIPFAKPVVWTVGGVGQLIGNLRGRPLVMNVDKAREATAGSWACSPQKAHRELGFAVGAPLADRLRQSADWYREQGWL